MDNAVMVPRGRTSSIPRGRTSSIPRGRTSSILLLALLMFGTIVIMTVPVLSQNSKYKISYITVYIWETIFLVSALVAMVTIMIFRKNNKHLMKETQCDPKQNVIMCFMAIFGVSASILSFYESKQVSTCLDEADKTQHKLQFVTYLCVGLYTVFQSMFGVVCYNYRCQGFVTRTLVAIIISANASLFSECVWNIFRSLNTQPSQDPFNSTDKNTSRLNYFNHTFVYSVCENGTEYIDNSITTRRIHKHTYPLLLEYLLFSVTFLVPLWNIGIHSQTHPVIINADVSTTFDEPVEHEQGQTETQPLISPHLIPTYTFKAKLVNSLKRASRFVSKNSIIFSSVFAATVFVLHFVVEFGYDELNEHTINNKNSTYQLEMGYYYLETVYIYIISSVPFIGYFIVRKPQNPTQWYSVIDTALLFVSGTGLLVLVLFQTVDSISVLSNHPTGHLTKDVTYFIKLLFDYVAIYFQIKFILRAMCLQVGTENFPDQKIHIKGIVIFLGFCNVERWLADSFMPPTDLWYANDIEGDDSFGHVNWWIIVQVLSPLLMFYRIWSALMCLKAYSMIQ